MLGAFKLAGVHPIHCLSDKSLHVRRSESGVRIERISVHTGMTLRWDGKARYGGPCWC